MKRFENKVVVVTGGNRNTGLSIVKKFLDEGARVFFCGSSESSTQEGRDALERAGYSNWTGVKCDVSKKEDVAALYDVVEKEAGRLDVVVSNAAAFGLGQGGPLDMTEEQFFSVLNTNLLGCFRVVQGAAKRFFVKQERDGYTNQCGVVVVVGSNSSERVSRNRTSYVSAKGGMDALVRSLAVDLGPMGIRVNMCAPGIIRTSRWDFLSDETIAQRRANQPIGRESTGEDVAETVAFLASPAARTFQGARLVQDGGAVVQLLPASCEDDTSKMREK